jgi:hypothetical protein
MASIAIRRKSCETFVAGRDSDIGQDRLRRRVCFSFKLLSREGL